MKILDGRRMAAVFAAYIGIFSTYVLLPNMRKYVFIIAILSVLLFGVNLYFKTRKQKISVGKIAVLLLMLISVGMACVRGANYSEKTDVAAKFYADGEIHSAEGVVTEVLYEENYGSAYEIRLFALDGKETKISLSLTMSEMGGLCTGDIVRFQGEMHELTGTYEIYQKAGGIFLSSETEDFEVIGEKESKTSRFFENVRSFIRKNFETYLKKDTFGIANALMTGNRENLDSGLKLAYTRLGISHLLAVSGLHLSIIVGGLDFLLRLVYVPKKIRSFILIGSAFFFACLCGLSASVVRAAMMLLFFYLADMLGEQNDSTTSLFFAIFLILICRPNAVYDIGMWLSFLATFGILAVLPAISMFSVTRKSKFYIFRRIAYYFISVVIISLAATLFTLPVVWIAFGGISLFAPFANLIFIPLTQIILYLLMFLTVFAWFPWLSDKTGGAIDGLADLSETLAKNLSDTEGIYLSLRYPFVPYLLLGLIIGVLIVLLIKRIRPVWMFTVFSVFMIAFGTSYYGYMAMNHDNSFVYLETDGKSDAVGFFSEGKTALVDVSTGGFSVYREVSQRIADFYETEIDVFILTHYHRYHAGTIRKLMENLKIHKVLLPEPMTEKEQSYFDQICSVIDGNAEIEIYPTDDSHRETVGDITLEFAETEYLTRSSHPLICFSADIGEDGKDFSYLSSGVTETDFAENVSAVTVIGTNGPVMKHIFDVTPLKKSELVIFSEKSLADWTEIEKISEKTVYAEDYGGYVKIMFE